MAVVSPPPPAATVNGSTGSRLLTHAADDPVVQNGPPFADLRLPVITSA
jgi:hypothetical protein